MLNGHLALFDGNYREKEVDIQFRIPSIYDLKTEYNLTVDDNKAQKIKVSHQNTQIDAMRLRKRSFSMNHKVDWELKFSEDMAEGKPLLEIILT